MRANLFIPTREKANIMAENLRKTAQAGRGHSKARLRLDTQPAKDRIVELVQQGVTISSALDNVGYARKTYEEWRRKDKVFAAKMDQARQLRAPDREVKRGERLGFAEWRAKYLNITTPWHQLQWVDLLEGREPRDLHPSQTYEPGKRGRLLVNCPPFHGKSICLTVDYVVYRLCLDPSYRVLIISAGAELAKDFVFAIKQRLTSPEFMDLQKAYAPDGGWEATAETWADGKITFGTSVRESSESSSHEKDANVLALGMRSKVYGRRADLVIVDDGVDSTNVAEHAKQMRWLRQMVETRIESGGRLLVVGTRVAPVDLYSELRKPENYANGKVPWTYLASPAILEESENPAEHKTLWPYADSPWVSAEDVGTDECICENTAECSAGVVIDGVQRFPRWDGVHLENGPRASNNNTDWALIFQQKSVAEDATFPEHAIEHPQTLGQRRAQLVLVGVKEVAPVVHDDAAQVGVVHRGIVRVVGAGILERLVVHALVVLPVQVEGPRLAVGPTVVSLIHLHHSPVIPALRIKSLESVPRSAPGANLKRSSFRVR